MRMYLGSTSQLNGKVAPNSEGLKCCLHALASCIFLYTLAVILFAWTVARSRFPSLFFSPYDAAGTLRSIVHTQDAAAS